MKVGGGGNWPIKLRLDGDPRSAIVQAARQNRQPGFDDVHKGANLELTFFLRARNLTFAAYALRTGATVLYFFGPLVSVPYGWQNHATIF